MAENFVCSRCGKRREIAMPELKPSADEHQLTITGYTWVEICISCQATEDRKYWKEFNSTLNCNDHQR